MSVIIGGMKMPNHCGECGVEWCGRWERLIVAGMPSAKARPEDCPLVPVPDHGRLIDADALTETFRERKRPTLSDGADGSKERVRYLDFISAIQTIKDAPTIIPADKERES